MPCAHLYSTIYCMLSLLSSFTFVDAGVARKMQELAVDKKNSGPFSEHSSREAVGRHLRSASSLCVHWRWSIWIIDGDIAVARKKQSVSEEQNLQLPSMLKKEIYTLHLRHIPNKWGIFRRLLNTSIDSADDIVKDCCTSYFRAWKICIRKSCPFAWLNKHYAMKAYGGVDV
jgi:hypothetical protein